ncbi:N-acetylglucosamine kinase [Haematobia irritans]|uniref:N-acetyl-D-glucosamine kinase n=1 Tax=Haematobia irritans TaxID=7368 RepID=A0A1L8EG10_HAEIR
MKYFGGIEGGATHSRLVICDENGECCATTTGLGTNHWNVGIAECARRIADMVERAKTDAGIQQETRLTSLGLSLSGCEQEATNRELEMELRTSFPDIADNYTVTSDTMGSIFTASPIGGMVVISGTGSNALLRNPDGSSYNCGGWGHFMGDEGSAWYISHRAMKIVFDDMDNFEKSPYPIQLVWKLIEEHFNIQNRLDLLSHCYGKFDKPFYASLCKKLSHAAEQGDELAKFLFHEAGCHLARSIQALLPKVHDDLVKTGYLSIACVGSVWFSWPLLKDGFVGTLGKHKIPFGLKLLRITKSMAYGACYLGADGIGFPLPRNYSDNFDVMFQYKELHTNGSLNGSAKTNGCSNTK